MEQRTLKAAYQFYCGKTLENAHSAEADIRATYEVLLAQVERYENKEWEDRRGNKSKPVQNDVPALHAFTSQNKWADLAGRLVYDDKGNEIFNFGKHKGRTCVEVFKTEPSYYAWMMQGDFALTTKKKLSQIWDRFQQQKNAVGEQSKLDLGAAKPAKPIDNDMLNELQKKFGKE
jgi:DNA polymerase-3 subunit epsilon